MDQLSLYNPMTLNLNSFGFVVTPQVPHPKRNTIS